MSTDQPIRPPGDLEEWMALYLDGDSVAAKSLIDCLSPRLHRFFVAQFSSRAEADDLLQETWLRIHKIRHTYRLGEPVLPWFYAIARCVRVDHYRKAVRTTSREERLEEVPELAALPMKSSPVEDLATILAPLPESQREVITMLKVIGMSLEEVARATSSSVGSVKQKAHRAYEKLRETMGPVKPGKRRSGETS